MALKTFREHLASISPRWLSNTLSEGFMGVVFGLVHDGIAQAVTDARLMGWVKEDSVPIDALPHLGRNFNLPRYPVETPVQHKERMSGAWDIWQFAGDEIPIESQLATLGFPGAKVYGNSSWTRGDPSYWSQFWLFFPEGSHAFGDSPVYGSAGTYGSGLIYGPAGITQDQVLTIRKIIRDWKPVDWICRGIIFEIKGPTYGTGHTYGEAGLKYGGKTVEIGA